MIHVDLRMWNPQLMIYAKDTIVQTVQPCRIKNARVEIDNLNNVEFILPNLFKSSKERITYVFPPGSQFTNLNEALDIIMVCLKKEEDEVYSRFI